MNNKKVYNCLYFGIWGYGYAGLKALYSLNNVNILNVFTRWDTKNKNSYSNKVYNFCIKKNIPFINSDKKNIKKNELEELILNFEETDYIVSCCFDRIFSKRIINFPKIAPINIHPSLLPKYRGIKPLENAIVKNEKFTGVTIHLLTEELDAGNILIQKGGIEINNSKTYKELYDDQCELIQKSIKTFFKDPIYYLENQKSQKKENVTFAPRLNITINDNDTVEEIKNGYKKI